MEGVLGFARDSLWALALVRLGRRILLCFGCVDKVLGGPRAKGQGPRPGGIILLGIKLPGKERKSMGLDLDVHPVGFEPTSTNTFELESNPLDRSGTDANCHLVGQ